MFSMTCLACGTIEEWPGDSAIEAVSLSGWRMIDSGFNCPQCSPGQWTYATKEVVEPDGYEKPELVCGCGKITKRRSGKCRKCKRELKEPKTKSFT